MDHKCSVWGGARTHVDPLDGIRGDRGDMWVSVSTLIRNKMARLRMGKLTVYPTAPQMQTHNRPVE